MATQKINTKIHVKNKTMETADIKLHSCVGQTKPKKSKLLQHFQDYAETEKLPRKIIVDDDNNIVDGLCTYIVAKTMGVKTVDVLVVSVSFS